MAKRLLLFLALIAAAACRGKTTASKPPLSVLLVTIDTLRADRLGAYGDAKARTPILDGLARQGVLFERAYTPVPITLPATSH